MDDLAAEFGVSVRRSRALTHRGQHLVNTRSAAHDVFSIAAGGLRADYCARGVCHRGAAAAAGTGVAVGAGAADALSAHSPMGALWWAAFTRCQGDELIPIAEAAALAGVSVSTMASRVNRGSLKSFLDPSAPNPRQRRRLVRKSDIAGAS